MKSFFVVLLAAVALSAGQSKHTIRVKIERCTNVRWEHYGQVYLKKDGKKIDSVRTFRYVSKALFSYWKKDYDFTFENLDAGTYRIEYNHKFNVDEFVDVTVGKKKLETVTICFDQIPEKYYAENTALHSLHQSDTLRINCYIAAGGEFGGYDEGLWIMRQNQHFVAQYYLLPNTYAKGLDFDRIAFYESHRATTKPITHSITLTNDQVRAVDRFLIEIKYFRTGGGWSNAPEFFSIYSKTDTIRNVKLDSNWKPYLDLKRIIPPVYTTKLIE